MAFMKAIINGTIIHNQEILADKVVLFDKKIIAISGKEAVPHGCEIINAKGCYVSAGFIDIHIHGSGGADVMDATPEALETISRTLLQTGTTSFVATTMTMSQPQIIKALDAAVTHGVEVSGASIVGIHLEGPFINPFKSGAQDSSQIQKPNFDWITPYLDYIKVITLAPEIEGAKEFIRHIHKTYPKIVLSIGHSEANYDEAIESFGWGISHATHLFNAMPPWHHRDPGLIGAVMDSDVTADIIADLIHTHPSVLHAVHKIKKERLILITDAMRAGCMQCGRYDLGGQEVTVSDGRATLSNGVLAGSVLRLNDAVKNLILHSDATLAEAVYAVTALPAWKLGLMKGRLEKGYDADIVIFDNELTMKRVYVGGVLQYEGV